MTKSGGQNPPPEQSAAPPQQSAAPLQQTAPQALSWQGVARGSNFAVKLFPSNFSSYSHARGADVSFLSDLNSH